MSSRPESSGLGPCAVTFAAGPGTGAFVVLHAARAAPHANAAHASRRIIAEVLMAVGLIRRRWLPLEWPGARQRLLALRADRFELAFDGIRERYARRLVRGEVERGLDEFHLVDARVPVIVA